MSFEQIEVLNLQSRGKTVFSEKEIIEVIHETLQRSKSWDIGLGYFAFSGFRSLAWSMAKFLLNDGVIRIYCNEVISKKDFDILTRENRTSDLTVFRDFKAIYDALTANEDELFADCISYLMDSNRLEIVVLVRKDDHYGISHHKDFIFNDENGGSVVLSGSANVSESAWFFNNETMNAYSSYWDQNENSPTAISIKTHKEKFEKYFTHGDAKWQTLKIDSEVLKERIHKIGFKKITKEQLKNSLKSNGKYVLSSLPISVRKEIEEELRQMDPTYVPAPFFPYDKPYKYQESAFEAWEGAGHKGLFAMATGTGKTLTAINCLVNDYSPTRHRFIFVVPGEELVRQWTAELEKSSFGKILKWYSAEGDSQMTKVKLAIDRLRNDPTSRINIAITYDGFFGKRFQRLLGMELSSFTIVFDECHEMGSPGRIKNMPDLKECKLIGLSATPERQYDEDGTDEFIQSIFNCKQNKYTFEFPMSRAIDEGFLVKYDYNLSFVHLNENEWTEYKELTSKLWKSEDGKRVINQQVALKRARIVQKTQEKLLQTTKIVRDLYKSNDHRFTLLFCPEGKPPEHYSADHDRNIDLYLETLCSELPQVKFEKIDSETENRRNILETFADGEYIHQLLSMKVLDQGVNIPNIRNAVLISSATVHRQHIQRRGRILRTAPGKDRAMLHDIITLAPLPAIQEGDGLGLLRNEFRRIHEFSRLSQNHHELIEEFDNFLATMRIHKTYDILLKETEEQNRNYE